MSRITLTLCLMVSLALVACEEPAPTGPAAPPSASAPVTDEEIDQARIPVKEDFEQEAETTINENNVEGEVDKLEKAIMADNP